MSILDTVTNEGRQEMIEDARHYRECLAEAIEEFIYGRDFDEIIDDWGVLPEHLHAELDRLAKDEVELV